MSTKFLLEISDYMGNRTADLCATRDEAISLLTSLVEDEGDGIDLLLEEANLRGAMFRITEVTVKNVEHFVVTKGIHVEKKK